MPEEVKKVKEVEISVEETQGVKEELAPDKPKEGMRFELTDNHAEVLIQHASSLQGFYAMIGQQTCELLKGINQASSIEKTIDELQNDIARELKVPRANRISWNLAKKYVEVID